jgi:hypothetical protein
MPLTPSFLKALDDMVRADLINQRDWYASCIFWSTLAVVVGCAMEVPEVLHELWPRLFAERFARPIKWVASIGLGFVVLGIAGELCFEHWRSGYEGLLVDAERQISSSELQAGDAKYSAEKAAVAADRANLSAGAAVKTAGDANLLAEGARKEADSFEHDIFTAKQQSASATKQAAEAQSHLADALQRAANAEAELNRLKTSRSIIHSNELIAALRPFAGTAYIFNTFMGSGANSARAGDGAIGKNS